MSTSWLIQEYKFKALWSFLEINRKDHCGVLILQESTVPLINKSHNKVGLPPKLFLLCVYKRRWCPLPNITEQRAVPDMESIIVKEVVNLLNTLQPNKASAPNEI